MIRISNREIALLGILSEGPLYGYKLNKIIEEQGMRYWTDIGFSSIYYALKRLEDAKLLQSRLEAVEGKPSRRVYTITTTGKKVVKEKVKSLLSNYERQIYSFDLGIFNIPLLTLTDVVAELRHYIKSINERLDLLESLLSYRNQSGASYIMVSLFTRPMAHLRTEKAWVEQFIQEIEGKLGNNVNPST
ncbi:PadR family transcriptional regulator [Chloroflexota bacterium]